MLVLGGGPDAEREVSIASATAIEIACREAGLDTRLEIIGTPDQGEVDRWDADVIFPALHGRFGEGGTLQKMLENAGKAFIGSRSQAAKLAMDKMGTKLIASRFGIPTPAAVILDPADVRNPALSFCPLQMPVVIKPVAEGSSVGLHICRDESQWRDALDAIREDLDAGPERVYMVERMVAGRELTVSVLCDAAAELIALPIVEIAPKDGVYDFRAKYQRSDTRYTVNPDLPDEIGAGIQEHALLLCVALGVRHLARVDFLYSEDGHWALLEANTMPGFTATSLLPMAAAAHGLPMPALCAHLVNAAVREHRTALST
ncbi:MAG: D-alanine--D-alanine ligase [Phycisphaerales bacterium]